MIGQTMNLLETSQNEHTEGKADLHNAVVEGKTWEVQCKALGENFDEVSADLKESRAKAEQLDEDLTRTTEERNRLNETLEQTIADNEKQVEGLEADVQAPMAAMRPDPPSTGHLKMRGPSCKSRRRLSLGCRPPSMVCC